MEIAVQSELENSFNFEALFSKSETSILNFYGSINVAELHLVLTQNY